MRPIETAEIAPLIQKIGATSIGEIQKLIDELQEVKNFLQFEGKRNSTRDDPLYEAHSYSFSLGRRQHRPDRPVTLTRQRACARDVP
jgi:hypothetical protein